MVGMPSPADGPGVDVEVRDQVLHLRLNRPDRTSALAPRLYGRGRCETNSGSTREGDVPGGRFERTDGMTSTSQTARHHASTCAELAILKGCSRFGSPMI